MLEQFYLTARIFICVMCVFTLVVCWDRQLVGFEQRWAGRSWVIFQIGLLFNYAPSVFRDISPFSDHTLFYVNEQTSTVAVTCIAVAIIVQLIARCPESNRHRIVISAVGVWLAFSAVVMLL